MSKLSYTKETLYHFRCGVCHGHWTIGDYVIDTDNIMFCPHCGYKDEVKAYNICLNCRHKGVCPKQSRSVIECEDWEVKNGN